MLIFWQGRGWLVPLIMFGWIFFAVGVMIATMGSEASPNPDASTDRTFALGFALSAANVFYLHWRRGMRVRAAGETGSESGSAAIPPDSFMFVPVKYWAYLFAAVAVYLLGHSFTV